jgi:5-(carboxyamino)imidazole ribonucleotide synthase
MSVDPLWPGPGAAGGEPATLGVLGGGQLGRMFVHAAQSMGYQTVVLDPDPASPAGLVAHHHVRAGYQDEAGLAQLLQRCHAITTEFENVPAAALERLEAYRPIAPGAQAVATCQDRAREKAEFVRCGVPCAPHALVATPEHLAAVPDDLLPGILKTTRMGYDGRGQIHVATRAQLAQAWQELKGVSCVLEKRLPLQQEFSVIVARSARGEQVHFPAQQNLHRSGILAVTTVPAPDVPAAAQQQALGWAGALAQALDYVGVLCVEFFVLQDGSLVANEMAPRPHNSGHYSVDACDLSQFDLQVRCMAGLPLVAPRQHSGAVMLNLLGDLWFDASGLPREPDWAQVLSLPGAHLHLYGKLDARPGRKMGHLTMTAATPTQARTAALDAARVLGLGAF